MQIHALLFFILPGTYSYECRSMLCFFSSCQELNLQLLLLFILPGTYSYECRSVLFFILPGTYFPLFCTESTFAALVSTCYRLPISRRNMSSPPTSVLKGQTALPTDKVQQIGLLDAVNDKYGGVVVDMKEPMDSHIYVPLLRASISQWRQQGKKGVWIKLPIQQANLVEPTVKEGFRYHHAESNYLMLVYWIPDSPDTLPANASHIVGIGAFVMNNKREVLVVKEKHGYFEGKDAWKFPTGVVNQGEDICAAAIREVKEETGIDTEFMEILAFSQTHQQFLGKSDLFFVCMLQPLSFDITKQDSEIKAAQWIPIDEYVNQTYNREHKPFEYVAKICLTKSQSNYGGFSAVHTLTSSGKQPYLYFNGQDFKP